VLDGATKTGEMTFSAYRFHTSFHYKRFFFPFLTFIDLTNFTCSQRIIKNIVNVHYASIK